MTVKKDHPCRSTKNVVQRQLKKRSPKLPSINIPTTSPIVDALPPHIAIVDVKGIIISVNDALKRFATANVFEGGDFGLARITSGCVRRLVGIAPTRPRLWQRDYERFWLASATPSHWNIHAMDPRNNVGFE